VTFFVARSILQAHGLEIDKDVTILAMGRPDVRYQALMTGNVQAAVANFDGTGLLETKGFHSVAKAGKYGKGFAGSLSVTQEQLERRPEEVVKFIRATLKGTRAYLRLREEAIKITSEWSKITTANAAKVHDLMSAGALAPDGLLDRATMEAVIADAREVGGSKRSVKLDEVFDFRVLQMVNEELQGWRP